MSRIGKIPIIIPNKVKVNLKNNIFQVIGPKGTLRLKLNNQIKINIDDKQIAIKKLNQFAKSNAIQGLMRSVINNMIIGVLSGYKKELEIFGTGYKVEFFEEKLKFFLGFSHYILIDKPIGITFYVNKNKNKITIEGIDKQAVGQIAAKIRMLKKPDPYKGKGIRYINENVRRKAGKAGK